MRRKISPNRLKQRFFRISTKKEGSTLKIFGDELIPSIPSQTLLLSINDTAEWIVKQMLLKYGLKHENPQNYSLVKIIIPSNDENIQEILLENHDCPLEIFLNHSQKTQDSIIFKIRRCTIEQYPNRIIPNSYPLLIEIDSNGNNLLIPRLFKIYSNKTYVGCNTKIDIGRQYFYINDIGIEENHCFIVNDNGFVRLIPQNGQSWFHGKLLTQELLLEHGMLICFGKQSNFRFYDEKTKRILQKQTNENHRQLNTMYSSLPILSKNNIEKPKNFKQQKLNILPGLLEVHPENEKRFLQSIFYDYPLQNIHFRLMPVYTIYLTIRQRLSPYDKFNFSLHEKQQSILEFLNLIENFLRKKIQECQNNAAYLAYWLANLSELIFFLKQDRDLKLFTYQIQIHFMEYLHQISNRLIEIFRISLSSHLHLFTKLKQRFSNKTQEKSSEFRWIFTKQLTIEEPVFDDILDIFSSIIDLLRKCRVNAGLTIEIFSQLFHYINAYLFNQIVCYSDLCLCSKSSGEFISNRLKTLEQWALNEGLERPYQCHLVKLNQLCDLLKTDKHHFNHIENLLINHSFQINSIQIKQILRTYILTSNELPISNKYRQNLLSMAYEDVDKKLEIQGFSIDLFEDEYLNVPFYLPANGYTCESLRGIPRQLFDFILPMKQSGLCRLFTNSFSLGYWTEFLQISNDINQQLETIVLNKKNNSLGLTIVCIKDEYEQSQGIYIKEILARSAADDEGHLQIGDQILSVNQINLKNATQEQATEALKQSGVSVTLQILKNAAILHGFAELFTKLSSQDDAIASQTTEISSRAAKEFDEKLKRRLEQFEYERTIERESIRQMSLKRQSEFENRLRKDREREVRADRDIEQYRLQRHSLQDRLIDAEKEQTRLLKHICLSNKK